MNPCITPRFDWYLRLITCALLVGCSSKIEFHPQPNGYRIVGYDGVKGEWTLVQTLTYNGEYSVKRFVLQCAFFKWGNREAVKGQDACNLEVGRLLVPNLLDKNRKERLLQINQIASDGLAISEGEGDDEVKQHFKILKVELLWPKPDATPSN